MFLGEHLHGAPTLLRCDVSVHMASLFFGSFYSGHLLPSYSGVHFVVPHSVATEVGPILLWWLDGIPVSFTCGFSSSSLYARCVGSDSL